MSRILVIDTSSKNLYVMLLDGKKSIKITMLDNQKQHSVVLSQAIEEVLQKANIPISEIDVFAVCIGVGSFTGIRVGVSVAKGLNFGSVKKFVEVNSLQTLAYTKKGCITCLADAGKGYYYAVYDGLKQIVSPSLITNDQAQELLKLSDTVCFDSSKDYSNAIEQQVRDKVANGEFSSNLVPLYVRRCQAEEERNS